MKNVDIRNVIRKKRIYQYEIADQLGVSEFTLSRWLRDDLSDSRRKDILSAIGRLTDGLEVVQ